MSFNKWNILSLALMSIFLVSGCTTDSSKAPSEITQSGGGSSGGSSGGSGSGCGDNCPSENTLPIHSLTTSYGSTCAHLEDGVKCWGMNLETFLPGTKDKSTTIPVWVLPLGSGVTRMSHGAQTCVIINGGLKCWGMNNHGQLGPASNKVFEPSPVTIYPPNSGITDVSTGYAVTCVIKNGGVYCWGNRAFGAVGNGPPDLTGPIVKTPAQIIPEGSGVTSIEAGYERTCAVVAGGLKCWGWNNSQGVIGNGVRANGSDPSSIIMYYPVDVIPAGSGVVKTGIGHSHTCAVVKDGLKCWGTQAMGTLGDGVMDSAATAGRTTPYEILPEGSGVSSVSSGVNFSCAIIRGGMKCWGDNNKGQFGGGAQYSTTPREIFPESEKASVVSGYYYHACAVLDRTKVRCWGENYFGQLGDGTVAKTNTSTSKNINLVNPVATTGNIIFSRVWQQDRPGDVVLPTTAVQTVVYLWNIGGKYSSIASIQMPSGFNLNIIGNELAPPSFPRKVSFPLNIGPGEVYTLQILPDSTVPTPKSGVMQINNADPNIAPIKVNISQ
jgi:hypothetical protein